MNYTTAIFLINDSVRAITCVYDEAKTVPTLFKTFDTTIRPGDLVVVPTGTRHGMTVVKVMDTDVDVNFDDPTPVAWIVGKVDRALYDIVLGQEADAIATIRSAEKTRQREQLKRTLLADNAEALKMLPIANQGLPPVNPKW